MVTVPQHFHLPAPLFNYSNSIMSASKQLNRSSILLGSAFLMATSAIGPGFITQTTVFTDQLKTSFGFVILCSVVLDIVVQLNIWRIISVSGLRAQDLSNKLLPGSGYLLAFLIVIGGLAFNIGNVAGASMGIQVLAGTDLWIGVVISVLISLLIFWYKEAGKALDLFSKVLGGAMILLTAYIAISSNPPLISTLHHTFVPEVIDSSAIIVLVGGTVGGYISFAGVHRLLDAGIVGEGHLSDVSRSSVKAILLASAMRILLFLAALGVVMAGASLDASNPAASVFQIAAGGVGYRVFGIVLWCASITSVVGSAYTSVSFLRTFHPFFEKNYQVIITFFIVSSALVFLVVGRPVNVLIVVGALNAFILPVSLALILLAVRQRKLMGNYRHPLWMEIAGWIVTLVLVVISVKTVLFDLARLWG
jgi:Mn2+/Fe2+ NRAMP family transporter